MALVDRLLQEIVFKASRSGGAGGQHVNKVSTRMELYFDVNNSLALTPEQRDRLLVKLGNKISNEGVLRLVCQSERSQPGNKRVCIEKFKVLISKCFAVERIRKATKATKASKEKRLIQKKKHGEIKQLRRNKGV